MIVRVAFIGLLLLALFYGLLRVVSAAPFARTRAVAWTLTKRLALFVVALALTVIAINVLITVDHIF